MRQAERRAPQPEAFDHVPEHLRQALSMRRFDVAGRSPVEPGAQFHRDASGASMEPKRVGARLQGRACEAEHHLLTRFLRPIKVVAQARQCRRAFVPSLVGALGRVAADGAGDVADRILARVWSQGENTVFVDFQFVGKLLGVELLGEEFS